MLKKLKFSVFMGVMLVCLLPLVAAAYTVNYNYTANGNNFEAPYYSITEDFDGPLAWTWTGSYAVVNGSANGLYSAPGGIDGVNKDTTNYVTVPAPITNGNGSVRVTGLGGTYNYFGLWWGSMDTYNTLTFYNNNVVVLTLTGSDVAFGNANGNQTAPATNHYVNFLGLPDFDSFQMSSTQFAFEADNIAIGRVPEPATMLLLGLGLLGLAGAGRKFKK
jgi:hypothetical protein